MAQVNGTTRKRVDFSKLEEDIERLATSPVADTEDGSRVLNYLEWLNDMLTNRRLYHKKQQVKKRLIYAAAEKLLDAGELAEIDKQAEEMLGSE